MESLLPKIQDQTFWKLKSLLQKNVCGIIKHSLFGATHSQNASQQVLISRPAYVLNNTVPLWLL